MNDFRFPGVAAAIARAAGEGVTAAGKAFAAELRGAGRNATHRMGLDGTTTVALEGANVVAPEFGTLSSPAQPVLSPALRARRAEVARQIGRSVAKALARKNP